MNAHMLSATLKDNAKERLAGHFGLLIGCQLTVICITLLTSFILTGFIPLPTSQTAGALFTYTAFSSVVSLLIGTFTGVLQVGLAFIYLKFASGNTNASLSDIFYGFTHDLQTALGISFIMALIGMLPTLFSDIFYNIHLLTGNQTYWYLSVFGEPAVYGLCFIVSLVLFPCYYLILDFPGKSVGEILCLSLRVMKGHKGKLLYIVLSFLPLELLSILSLVGFFWVAPYQSMTQALLFFKIMEKETVSK